MHKKYFLFYKKLKLKNIKNTFWVTYVHKMIKINLEKAGNFVDVAKNGREALDMMIKKYYDVVLMDIRMPVMGGVEAVINFRNFEGSFQSYVIDAATPLSCFPRQRRQLIVGMSANSDFNTREDALRSGMDAFLNKPFSLEAIVKVVREYTEADAAARAQLQLKAPGGILHDYIPAHYR